MKYRKFLTNFFLWPLWTNICGKNQIMQRDHSNETSLAVFSRGTFYFSAFYKVKFWNFVEFFTLCFFGSVRLIIRFRVYELICPRCRSFPWTHLLKKLFNMCFSKGRQAFVSFAIFTDTITNLGSFPHPP